VRGDTRRYRTIHPYEQLRLAGVDCALSHLTDPKLPGLIEQAGLVIFHRTPLDDFVGGLLARLRQRGALAVLDVDDLVFDPAAFEWIDSPDFKDPLRSAIYREEMQRQLQMLEASQAVLASTEFLAERARSYGKPAWVHRNAFSLEMLTIAKKVNSQRQIHAEKIVIGYASGTPTHDRDFALVRPALQQVLQRYPHTELWLVGPVAAGSDWDALQPRIKRFKLVPWRELPALQAQFDINLAPLVLENPFGCSKSEIKYVEAGLVQVPTVASPSESFRFSIRHAENGLLASSHQEWIDGISVLVEHPELRRTLAERAQIDIIERYHPRLRAAELLVTLNQVSQRLLSRRLWAAAPQRFARPPAAQESPLTGPKLEQHPSYFDMGLYTLRRRGWRLLLKQVRVFFRRMVAPIFPYR
jgi:glycosyltransferase involved in cell wall biosynthesis